MSCACAVGDRAQRSPSGQPAHGDHHSNFINDTAKNLHQKSRRLIIIYAPEQWRITILNGVDSFYQYVDTVTQMDNRTIKYLIPIGVIVCLLLLYSMTVTFSLGLALPFYAAYSLANWAKTRSPIMDISENLLNFWWCIVIGMEISCWLLRRVIEDHEFYDQISYYTVPLLALAGAKLILDRSDLNSEIQPPHWIFAYFAFTYGIRCFAIRGFALLPTVWRPFFGHLACWLAARRTAPQSIAVKRPSVHFCGHCMSGPVISRSADSTDLLINAKINNNHAIRGSLDGDLPRFTTAAERIMRRKSLPAGSLAPIRAQSNISEARGLVADMLAQKDLPPHLVSGLKAVNSLLMPVNQYNNLSRFDFMGNLPGILNTPYIGSDVTLVEVESVGQRRSSPIVITWSTTTSATGLPCVEPEPSRSRSSSYWRQMHISDDEDGDKKNLLSPKHSSELEPPFIQLSDGSLCDVSSIDEDEKLSRVQEWAFPIFDLYSEWPDTVLTRMAYKIFKKSGFFRIFKLPKQKFLSFFHALEQGYWDIPYHNRIHAADVMHATYYLASNKVPAANDKSSITNQRDQIDQDSLQPDQRSADISRKWSCSSVFENGLVDDEETCNLASIMSSLEVMALYTAAAMHDHDHPGRTNAFLVAIEDKKSILYNDRSVLENHHAASSWQLLIRPENNFIEHLDAAEFKRFRYIIIEAILATDLKRHFEILMDFNGKVSNRTLDWDNEGDKLLTCQVCIKMADINSPTKPYPLHREWTNRIVEEFYAQGDEESHRGLPVSPYMDRGDPQLAKLQDSFITHLVAPLARAMNDAGLLPLPSSVGDADAKPELLYNLDCNQAYWKKQLGESDSNSSPVGEERSEANEMETIRENDEDGSSQNDVSL